MTIAFAVDRWAELHATTDAWWAGTLQRPLLQLLTPGHDPGRPAPKLPHFSFPSFYDFSVPVEAIVDRYDYLYSCYHYCGDAFPHLFPNFGPGVAAVFFGARPENAPEKGTVWFHPPHHDQAIADLDFQLDRQHAWYQRLRDFLRACNQRWHGAVQVGMTDLGGSLDILSSFRPSDQLLFDLYDAPNEIKRLNWRQHELWWRAFAEFDACLRPGNPGWSAWSSLFSTRPSYIFQCDFSYMIGPEMFAEFVMPELAASFKKVANSVYHLDGPGEIPHLDQLLANPDLKCIQWVPTQPRFAEWCDLYKRIRAAGKRVQIAGPLEDLPRIAEAMGGLEGFAWTGECQNRETGEAWLRKLGVRRHQ